MYLHQLVQPLNNSEIKKLDQLMSKLINRRQLTADLHALLSVGDDEPFKLMHCTMIIYGHIVMFV